MKKGNIPSNLHSLFISIVNFLKIVEPKWFAAALTLGIKFTSAPTLSSQ